MTVQTNTSDRKAMAHALAGHLGTTVRFLGIQTCGYQVGDYTVNRDGSITGDDIDAIREFLVQNGYIDEPEPADPQPVIQETAESSSPEAATDTQGDTTRIDLLIPAADMTPSALKNLFNMVYSKQMPLNHMLGADLVQIPKTLIIRLKETLPETNEAFAALLDEMKVEGLKGFDYRDGKVVMSIPNTGDSFDVLVYSDLLGHIIRASQAATRVQPDIREAESEKYTVRTWLLRLGYGGPDFKDVRRALMRNLKGPSAFPTNTAAQKHKDKYAVLRKQKRESLAVQPSDSETAGTVRGSEEAAV